MCLILLCTPYYYWYTLPHTVMQESGGPGPGGPDQLNRGRADYPHLLLLAPPIFFTFRHHYHVNIKHVTKSLSVRGREAMPTNFGNEIMVDNNLRNVVCST